MADDELTLSLDSGILAAATLMLYGIDPTDIAIERMRQLMENPFPTFAETAASMKANPGGWTEEITKTPQ
jgi:hypothetical protein